MHLLQGEHKACFKTFHPMSPRSKSSHIVHELEVPTPVEDLRVRVRVRGDK